MSKYPKLWGRSSAVGEAKVRQLQKIGTPWLRASGPGFVAEKQSKLSNVKTFGGRDAVVIVWKARQFAIVDPRWLYGFYAVVGGTRYNGLYDTIGTPTGEANGYYTMTGIYIGEVQITGEGYIMWSQDGGGPPFFYSVVETGESPGYYSVETGGRLADLLYTGSGATIWKWAYIDSKTLKVFGRGQLFDPMQSVVLQPSRLFARSKAVFAMADTSSGGSFIQPYAFNLKNPATRIDFTLSMPANYVVGVDYCGSGLYAVTQSVSGTSRNRLHEVVGGASTRFVDLQAEASWLIGADTQILVGGFKGGTGYMLEYYATDFSLTKQRSLGPQRVLVDVAVDEKAVAALTWRDNGNPSEGLGNYVRIWSKEAFLSSLDAENAPAPANVEVGKYRHDGAPLLGSGVYVHEAVAVSSGKVFSACFSSLYDGMYQQNVSHVFVQVTGADGEHLGVVYIDGVDNDAAFIDKDWGAMDSVRLK